MLTKQMLFPITFPLAPDGADQHQYCPKNEQLTNPKQDENPSVYGLW